MRCGDHNLPTGETRRCPICDIDNDHSSGARISRASSIADVKLSNDTYRFQAIWQGIDGYEYEARYFESEDSGGYLNITKSDYDEPGAPFGTITVWRLPVEVNLLKIIANGTHYPPHAVNGA